MNSAFAPDKLRTRLGLKYDTYTLPVNTLTPANIVMFSVPVSATKGLELTNMTDQNRLPAGEAMKVMAIRAVTIGMHLDDVLNLQRRYCMRFKIGSKYFLEAPIEAFPGGAGVAGAASISTTVTATTSTVFNWNNGIADPRAVYGLGQEYPLDLPSQAFFNIELTGTPFTTVNAGGTGIFLRVYLDGLLYEPLQ